MENIDEKFKESIKKMLKELRKNDNKKWNDFLEKIQDVNINFLIDKDKTEYISQLNKIKVEIGLELSGLQFKKYKSKRSKSLRKTSRKSLRKTYHKSPSKSLRKKL